MQIRYDLYRIPFNHGKGGRAEPIIGASNDGMSNNFPKVSPDGKWIVFISFPPDIDPESHPYYKECYIRLMSIDGRGAAPKVLAYIYGGQGSMNVPSWSPDSKKIAFVSNTDLSAQ